MDSQITIRVNGEDRAVRHGLTVEQLLRDFELQPKMIVVEHNGDILRREKYGDVGVSEGDALELVHFVGGG